MHGVFRDTGKGQLLIWRG